MDNLTHSLFAVTLARTPLGRTGRGTTMALLVASNAPDIDILASVGGGVRYLMWHRGPTHGPLGIVGLGVLTAAIVRLGQHLNPRWPDEPRDAPFAMLVTLSLLGTLFHVLMDLPTSYGTRLLSPFDWHWFAVDWLPIIDPYLLVVFVCGLVFGRASADARRRNAAIVLVLMSMNYGLRGAAHHQAVTLAPRLFGPTLPPWCAGSFESWLEVWPRPQSIRAAEQPSARVRGDRTRCLVQIAAIPTTSPFNWTIVAEMSNAYELHQLDLLDARFRESSRRSDVFWRRVTRYPNVWTDEVAKAAATRLGRTFLGFSRFPQARFTVDPSSTATVRFTDMRFVGPPIAIAEAATRGNLFTAVVQIDAQGKVVSERLGR